MKLQTSGVLGTSYAIAKLAPKRGQTTVFVYLKSISRRAGKSKKNSEIFFYSEICCTFAPYCYIKMVAGLSAKNKDKLKRT